MVMQVIVFENLINVNEMTRPGEKICKVESIVVHSLQIDESYGNNYIKYIEGLKYQSIIYLSYNYIIDECGKITMIIPETEISYHTPDILINNKTISIAVLSEHDKPFNKEQIKSLKYLLKYITIRNNISKKEIYLYSDIVSTRDALYYTDNNFEWKDIVNKK